ncbi:hypothetical protein Tco_0819078 [Tanacetum coccineum]|uniref:Uncharacterized protein n=1 Tax=Tanacetum coccineum TaxID=301880 RepID=A0ABQ5AA49_9ASTR
MKTQNRTKIRRFIKCSAVSRTTCEEEFLNKRDNPLYWGSPEEADNKKNNNNTSEESKVVVVLQNVAQRGRSVVRNSGGQMEIGRRGRSVSRPRFPQSEAEQESRTGITCGGRSGSIRASSSTGKLPVLGVKSFDRRSAHPSRHPSVGSSFDSQVSNWEDVEISNPEAVSLPLVGVGLSSSQPPYTMEDGIRTHNPWKTVLGVTLLYVRIKTTAIRRNTSAALVSTEVTDASKLVKPGAVGLVLGIRREYAKELEESQERARKLRSDLAIEEHRKQELSRILKENLPEPKTSSSHRSRGRKSSSERKKMSKRLTDEAMSYFDDCVSISAFDSSDFLAAEDPSVNSLTTTPIRGATSSGPNRCIDQQTFEKHKGLEDSASERSRANYNADAYGLLDVNESLLFDKVFFNNRQESGSLHICGGVAVPFCPLAHFYEDLLISDCNVSSCNKGGLCSRWSWIARTGLL